MEIDVGVFQKQVLQHFPVVKASSWMDYIGPGNYSEICILPLFLIQLFLQPIQLQYKLSK